ncbi:MAG: hypothetical protein IJ909_11300 [Fibrobacter sp.]|nr:hypothetical protein [Fibrobacter sp.]
MKKSLYAGISVVSTALLMSLVACGDDSSSGTKAKTPDLEVDNFEGLGLCTKTAEGTYAYVKDDNAYYTCEAGEWVKDGGKDSGKSGDSDNPSGDKGGKTPSGNDIGSSNSSGGNGGDSSGDNGDGTPYSFGPAGASLASEMFESLAGTAWADKEGDIHDKWTFSTLSDGKIPVVASMINDDGTPSDDPTFNYSLDVERGVLVDAFGDDDSYVIYADGLLFQIYLFGKYERDGFSDGLVGKWVNEDEEFITISADGKRSINNGVTSASIEKMSNGVMYYKLGSVPQYLYYDGTNIYEVTEVLYPVE